MVDWVRKVTGVGEGTAENKVHKQQSSCWPGLTKVFTVTRKSADPKSFFIYSLLQGRVLHFLLLTILLSDCLKEHSALDRSSWSLKSVRKKIKKIKKNKKNTKMHMVGKMF